PPSVKDWASHLLTLADLPPKEKTKQPGRPFPTACSAFRPNPSRSARRNNNGRRHEARSYRSFRRLATAVSLLRRFVERLRLLIPSSPAPQRLRQPFRESHSSPRADRSSSPLPCFHCRSR